jgi:hypothetical protein
VTNRKISGIDCGFIMAQSQRLLGLRNTTPNLPSKKAHVLAKLLPRHLQNMSRALPLYLPGFETIHFMISPTPSLDLISRRYFLFRFLEKYLEVHLMNLKIKRNLCS